jgi:hypothetical protein
LLSGEQGTAQTIRLMRKLVDDAVSDAQFVRFAIEIVRSVPAFDDFGEASAIYEWVKRNIRYTKDPVTKEKLYPPQELLKIKAGDCDDISMLLGALLLALGYRARLITISANAEDPAEFSHVYVEAEVPPGSGYWLPMDAARLDSQFGTEPPMYYRKRAWSLTDDSYQDLAGLACSGNCNACQVGGNRPLCGLAGYASVGMGQVDWSNIIQQSIQQIPAIISTARGGASSIRNPYGSVTTSPYGSFVTPYTPGYGVPAAGYASPYPSSWFSENWPLVAVLGIGLLVLSGRGKG